MKFRVRIYIKGSPPAIFPGGTDVLGAYLELSPSKRDGYETTPALRLPLDKRLLRRLPDGSDAEYEYLQDFDKDALRVRT